VKTEDKVLNTMLQHKVDPFGETWNAKTIGKVTVIVMNIKTESLYWKQGFKKRTCTGIAAVTNRYRQPP
jgi:hypothetical protein